MNTSDKIALGALVFSILSGLLNFLYSKHLDKIRQDLIKKQDRLEANLRFEKVRDKKERLEDSIPDLLACSDLDEKKKMFQKTITKFTALFNEVEDFANIINDQTIKSDNYIKDIVLPEIKKLADIQIEIFTILTVYAKTNKFDIPKRPGYKAFKGIDKLLTKYYGQDNHILIELKNNRKRSGLQL